MPSNQLLKIENATIKHRNQVLFENLDFEIQKDEHWAIVGEAGSGKSALLQALAGRYFIANGKITHTWYEQYRKNHLITDPLFSFRNRISYVDVKHDFTNLANTGDFYYQQRFNAGFSDNAQTVADFLKDTVESENPGATWTLDRVYETFHLKPLCDKHLIKLSNGETKRLRIAAALLKNPVLLLLDSPLAGLDVATRARFESVFSAIAASGICLVMVCSPLEIPEVITHVAELNNDRQLTAFNREAFVPVQCEIAPQVLPDREKLKKLTVRKDASAFELLVSMKNARVAYGDSVIFDRINWEIRQGERWALSGPNGSGKSTLLSLINGDHPQAYANDIMLFDRRRGSGESIWDIKKRIGFMSPEMYQYFPYHYNCLQVVESGFYDTIGRVAQSRPENREIAEQWMAIMGLALTAEFRLSEVPASQQRLCLLARALVKNPCLLILDEPCLGFDRYQQRDFRNLIDAMAEISDFSLVYVTHHQETLPGCITHFLHLGQTTAKE